LTSSSVSIHDEKGQSEDINNYIKWAVNEDRKNKKWRMEDKKRVIDILTKRAGGM
jgi:hypothetical protein